MNLMTIALLTLLARPVVSTRVVIQAPQTVTLAWDANAPSENVVSYTLCMGNAPSVYGTCTNVGNVLTFATPTLVAGTYYFAVKATDVNNFESNFSNEVSTPVPFVQGDPSCVVPLGTNVVSIFITKMESTTGSVGSQARLNFQLGSPGSPITSLTVSVNGVTADVPVTGTNLNKTGGIWFTTPSVPGTYPVTLTAANAVCTTTATKDALGNQLMVKVQ